MRPTDDRDFDDPPGGDSFDDGSFDERFADRVRDVFGAYEEPVDEGELARTLGALRGPAQGPARGDRPAAARDRSRWGPARRSGRSGPAALVALLVALAAGVWAVRGPSPEPEGPLVAAAPEAVQDADAPPGLDTGADDETGLERPSAGTAAPELAAVPGTRSARVPTADPPPRDPSAPAPTPVETTPVETTRDADAALPPVARADPEGPDPSDAVDSVEPGPRPGPEGLPDVAASVFAPGVRGPAALPALTPGPDPEGPDEGSGSGLRLVVSTAATFSGPRLADGAGLSTGLVREWALAPGLSVSGGAVAAYNRFAVERDRRYADPALYFEGDPTRAVEVTARTTVTTVALEVPLDLAVDVARAGPGRVRAGVGLTSALYVAQTFFDEGRRYSLAPASGGGGTAGEVQVDPFADREAAPAFGRLDLGRQLNLSLGYAAGAGGLGVDVYARVPLGGVTARDLPLTALGLRLRYAL